MSTRVSYLYEIKMKEIKLQLADKTMRPVILL